MRVMVEFIQQSAPYNVGETASFEQEQAENMVHRHLVKMRPDLVAKSEVRSPEQDPPPHLATQIAGDLHRMQKADAAASRRGAAS